ncbi:hypothetical protein [Mesobacillus thioparans]|uniref:hypothetical protein n=1 Tax=Mesobacillus thioparans TaxID=370439 RepID=UPI0039EE3CF0
MAKLRDYFFSDLDNVFFNAGEFATEAKIDGQTVSIIQDDELLKRYNLKNQGEGLAEGELLFYVKKADLTKEPFIEQKMNFNGSLYRISDLQENEGMFTITLVGYRS